MSDKKVHIWSKKISANSQGVIKITPKALSYLIDVANETGRSIRDVASSIIIQTIDKELIVYDREVE